MDPINVSESFHWGLTFMMGASKGALHVFVLFSPIKKYDLKIRFPFPFYLWPSYYYSKLGVEIQVKVMKKKSNFLVAPFVGRWMLFNLLIKG